MGDAMTTPRPVFGKKASAATSARRPAGAAPTADLSPEARAFLARERLSAGGPSYEEDVPSRRSADSVPAGKPVWGRRIIARLLDEFLIWMLIFLLFRGDIGQALGVYLQSTPDSAAADAATLTLFGYALLWGVVECTYNIAMEASRYQATLGKMLVGAVVTDRNGEKPGLGGVIMRNTLGRLLSNMIPFYIGYLMGLFNKDRRCAHDMTSGTMVRARRPAAAAPSYSEVFA